MECSRCGRVAEPDHNYCNGCGALLRSGAATADVGYHTAVDDDAEVETDLDAEVAWLDDAAETGEVPVVDDAADTGEVAVHPTVGNGAQPDAPTGARTTVRVDDGQNGGSDGTSSRGLAARSNASGGTNARAVDREGVEDRDVATRVEPAAATTHSPRMTAVIPSVAPIPEPTGVVPQTRYGRMVNGRQFKWSSTSVLGFGIGAAMLAVLLVPLLSVKSSVTVLLDNAQVPEGFRFGSWTIGSLGSNLPIAVLICVILVTIGATATGYGKAWGAGLVGGASLAFVGIAALVFGLLQFPVLAAYEFARIPTEVPIGLSITREPGYWMLWGCVALAVIATFSSFQECMSDRRRNLNPWFAAFGALSVLLLVLGTMIPLNGALISDNWFVIEGAGQAPQELVAGRLVQLGLLLLSGVGGFLLVRSYGLGLAVGGTVPSLWLGLSVLLDDNNPVGPGWRNPGATKMDVHPVTIIEMAVVLALLVLASLSAFGQAPAPSDGHR